MRVEGVLSCQKFSQPTQVDAAAQNLLCAIPPATRVLRAHSCSAQRAEQTMRASSTTSCVQAPTAVTARLGQQQQPEIAAWCSNSHHGDGKGGKKPFAEVHGSGDRADVLCISAGQTAVKLFSLSFLKLNTLHYAFLCIQGVRSTATRNFRAGLPVLR